MRAAETSQARTAVQATHDGTIPDQALAPDAATLDERYGRTLASMTDEPWTFATGS
jgi:hypothetical protein